MLSKADPRVILAVDFLLSQAEVVRICSDNIDRDLGGAVYRAHPELQVNVPDLNGELPTEGPSIQVAKHRLSFVQNLTSDRAYYSSVKVRIRKIVVEHGAASGVEVWVPSGDYASYSEEEGIVTLGLAGAFSKLEADTGWVVSKDCVARFADGHACTVNRETLKENGTITSHSNGTTIQITGLSAQPLYYWQRGFIRAGEIRVPIFYWRDGTTFETSRKIPKEWEDTLDALGTVAVEVLPGCRKTPADCNVLNPNPLEFKGIGIATPDRHPNLEVEDV